MAARLHFDIQDCCKLSVAVQASRAGWLKQQGSVKPERQGDTLEYDAYLMVGSHDAWWCGVCSLHRLAGRLVGLMDTQNKGV